MACTTVIWKLADWLSDQEDLKFVEASARWFSLAAHSALSKMTASEVEKCKRRAALGYIKAAKFDEAEDILETCDMKSAETRYLQFLIALRQGQLRVPCDALRAMGACEDLDGTHLLMTVQAANEASKVTVVARALATLLETLERTGMREKGVEELTLVRCLIKMSLNQLKEEVVGFAEEIRARDELATKYKEIAWLYKTAYNTSFEAVKVWEDKLMECYKSIPMQELDPKFQLQLATVRYFGLCVTVFASREIVNAEEKNAILQRAKSRIPECLAILETVQPTQDLDQKLCVNMVSTLHIFSCEIMVELEDWEAISMMAKKMQPGALSMETLQGMASLILTVKTPLEVADKVTREILRVVLSPTYGDNMAQQSRWMRATVDMLLHRGRTSDYDDALDYVQQAKGCMERGGKTYPSEEVDWLWRTCYNLSLDLADFGDKARCQKWMEIALALCTHAVNGESTKAEEALLAEEHPSIGRKGTQQRSKAVETDIYVKGACNLWAISYLMQN
ncbi:hypothetical protein FFLO_01533 [Filobasidium floriforme]|uniref:Protein ZIP4 homolog n=1 Tax=Filobasidium floriforme TaxID=5210 RepID=A0A8K0JR53_9TREE|nr:hypothetical protein FFLO_01533 [Filobasidium floriforme]